MLTLKESIVGYFGTWHVVDQLQLCTIAIEPDQQGQGLGAILLKAVFRLAQRLDTSSIQLEVRESNHTARTLYRTRGFEDVGIRKNLYRHPREDGILMSRETPETVQAVLPTGKPSSWTSGLGIHWKDRGGELREHWPASDSACDTLSP